MSSFAHSYEAGNTNSIANKSGNDFNNGSVVSAIVTDAAHTSHINADQISEKQIAHKSVKSSDKKHIVQCSVHLTRSTYYFEEAVEGFV